jgi:hypothetical protein
MATRTSALVSKPAEARTAGLKKRHECREMARPSRPKHSPLPRRHRAFYVSVGVDSCPTASGRRSWESGHSNGRRTSTATRPHTGRSGRLCRIQKADIPDLRRFAGTGDQVLVAFQNKRYSGSPAFRNPAASTLIVSGRTCAIRAKPPTVKAGATCNKRSHAVCASSM